MPALTVDDCWDRLHAGGHGTLVTLHPTRGPDPVPTVYAVIGARDAIALPVDHVKAKRHVRLRRLTNLAVDERAALLIDHYSDDWSQLWWVRVHGRAHVVEPDDGDVDRAGRRALARRHPAYEPPGSVDRVILLEPSGIAGWRA